MGEKNIKNRQLDECGRHCKSNKPKKQKLTQDSPRKTLYWCSKTLILGHWFTKLSKRLFFLVFGKFIRFITVISMQSCTTNGRLLHKVCDVKDILIMSVDSNYRTETFPIISQNLQFILVLLSNGHEPDSFCRFLYLY